MKRAFLVYQGGLANVFSVKCHNLSNVGREAKLLIQSDFKTCVAFARGLGAAGVIVHTAACNQPGDIRNAHWTEDLENQPFADQLIDLGLNV